MAKKQRGYVVTHLERVLQLHSLMKEQHDEVVQRLFLAAPAVWFQVKPFRHWVEQLVANGKFDTHIFHPGTVDEVFGFSNMQQLRRALPVLRQAWQGVVRVQLCKSKQDGWYLFRLRAI